MTNIITQLHAFNLLTLQSVHPPQQYGIVTSCEVQSCCRSEMSKGSSFKGMSKTITEATTTKKHLHSNWFVIFIFEIAGTIFLYPATACMCRKKKRSQDRESRIFTSSLP